MTAPPTIAEMKVAPAAVQSYLNADVGKKIALQAMEGAFDPKPKLEPCEYYELHFTTPEYRERWRDTCKALESFRSGSDHSGIVEGAW